MCFFYRLALILLQDLLIMYYMHIHEYFSAQLRMYMHTFIYIHEYVYCHEICMHTHASIGIEIFELE